MLFKDKPLDIAEYIVKNKFSSELNNNIFEKQDSDEIIFSDMSIKEKRIAIRKLKGLPRVFVKMFMKLFEYIAEV